MDQDWQPVAVGSVNPYRDLPASPGDSLVPHRGDGLGLERRNEARPDDRPCLRARHRVDRREAGVQPVDQGGELWIEAHAYRTMGREAPAECRGSNGRSGCSAGATRWGPPSTLRQTAIAVM